MSDAQDDGLHPHPDDAEFRAMALIVAAMEMVEAEARVRILAYVMDRFGIDGSELT